MQYLQFGLWFRLLGNIPSEISLGQSKRSIHAMFNRHYCAFELVKHIIVIVDGEKKDDRHNVPKWNGFKNEHKNSILSTFFPSVLAKYPIT